MESFDDVKAAAPYLEEGSLVEEVRLELQEIDSVELNDHAQRYEALYQRLSSSLSAIDGL